MLQLLWFLVGSATTVAVVVLANAFRQRPSQIRRRVPVPPPKLPQDISETMEIELAHELLDDTSRGLESLADSVGNELANMTSGVEGHAELLCESIGDPRLSGPRAENLSHSVRRLRLFSEKILSFAHRETLEVQPLHVRNFLGGLGQELENHSGNSINVVWETSEFLPLALASERELRNALMFLADTLFFLENRASRLSLRAYAQLSEVQDTRVDIEMCAEAEDPNQPQRQVKQEAQLGYLAARNLLAAQGATLSFKQLEGLSVSCFVSLQATDAVESPEPPPVEYPTTALGLPPSSHPYGGVLILEGEESIRSLVSQELEQSGRNIVACLDGAAARSLLQATPDRFEVILLEEEARLQDGFTIAALALELNPDVRVLLLTSSHPTRLPATLRSPRVHVLVKPFGIHELRAALCALVLSGAHGPVVTAGGGWNDGRWSTSAET